MSLAPDIEGVSAEQPWPGLMPFTEEAQAYFHGRDAEADELMRLLRRETLTVLFGQSGLGKSSLLNAGLFPRLRREDSFPIYIRLDVSPSAPPLNTQTGTIVAAELARHGVDARAPAPGETLWEYCHATDVDFWSARNRLLTPVLVFDQFEEIFTLGRHSEEARERCRAFIAELSDLVENRAPEAVAERLENEPDLAARLDFGKRNCKVLLSFREDFLPEFEGLRRQMRSIMQNRMRLTRMNGSQALEAITLSGGHLVAPGVAERIVQFVAGAAADADQPGVEYERLEIEPALLSVVCRELNTKRIAAGRRQITADLLEAGAQQEIIADFYERSLTGVDPRVRVFVEDKLLTGSGFRSSYALDDAKRLPGVTQQAIDTLVAGRLLRLEERFGVVRIELTHDVLTKVVRESRDRRQAREAEARRREQELARRRRSRRLIGIGAASGVTLVGLVILFAVLMQSAIQEKNRVVETQANVLVTQANIGLESRTPRDPQAYLAKAIRLSPHNDAATARIVTLFNQRRYPMLLDSRPVPEWLAGGPVHWVDDQRIALGEYVVAADDLYRTWSLGASRDERTPDAWRLVLRRARKLAPQPARPAQRKPDARTQELSFTFDAAARAHVAKLEVHEEAGTRHTYAIFDAASLAPLQRPIELKGAAGLTALSRDRTVFVIAHRGGEVEVRKLGAGAEAPLRLRLSEEQERNLAGIEAMPDASGLLIWFGDGTASMFDPVTGAPRWTRTLPRGTVPAAQGALSPRGRWLAVVQRNVVQLIDPRTGDPHGKPLQHAAPVNAIAFSANDELLATACQDQTARIWHAQATSLAAPPLGHDAPVVTARFSNDAAYVVTASLDGTVRVWNAAGEALAEPMLHEAPVAAAEFSRDGNRVVTLSREGRMYLWHPNHRSPPHAGVDHAAPVTALAGSPDGRLLATGTARGEVRIWSLDPGHDARGTMLVPRGTIAAHDGAITSMRFSTQGARLATAGADGTLRVWEVSTRKETGAPMRHRGAVRLVRFSRDDAWVVTVSDDRAARMWSVADAAQRGLPMRHENAVIDAQMTGDGQTLVTAAANEIRLWDAATGAILSRFRHTGRVNAFSLSPDGHEVLAAAGHEIALWRIARGVGTAPIRDKPDASLAGRSIAWNVRHSRDGRFFASGGLDGVVQVWARQSLRPVSTPMKHNALVTTVEFSADGRWLVTGSRDRIVRLWDAASGQMVADALRHDYDVTGYVVAPNADWLVTGSADGRARLWELGLGYPEPPPPWIAAVVEAVGGARVDESGALVLTEGRARRLTELTDNLAARAVDGYWVAWSQRLLGMVIRAARGTARQEGGRG